MSWQLQRIHHLDDTTHTGSWGAEGNDVTCVGFRAKARVKWDLRNPPNFLVQNGGQIIQPNFNLGYQLWLYVGSGANYPTDTAPYYYFAPSAKGSFISTIIDAFAKKQVEAEVEIVGNSPIFALNTQGSGLEMSLYNAYIAHCQTRSWVW
jgi:hypothetical protein